MQLLIVNLECWEGGMSRKECIFAVLLLSAHAAAQMPAPVLQNPAAGEQLKWHLNRIQRQSFRRDRLFVRRILMGSADSRRERNAKNHSS